MTKRTIQLKTDGTKIVLGRRLTKAEKKAVKKHTTRVRLARQGKAK